MPTPGLPEIKDDLASNDDNVMKSFNNFRRLTLLRYLDGSANHTPELKAKILDWKPEVLSSKTRHQTTKAREVTAYKEIFGTKCGDQYISKYQDGGMLLYNIVL